MPEAAAPAPAASTNGATPPAAAKTPAATATQTPEQFFEVKVGGEMKKYSRTEAERLLSRRGFDEQTLSKAKQAMAEAAQLREERERERQAAKERAKQDTDAWMLEHGIDPDAYARSKLEKKLAEHQKTPEQREKEAAEARAKAAEDKLKAVEEEKKSARQAEAQRHVQRQMENQLAEAAERAGMPKDGDSFFAIYEAVKEWHRLGLPWDAERIVETAKENIDGGFKRLEQSVLKGLKGQALEDRLGKSVVDELIKHRIEKARNGTGAPARGATSATQAPARGSPSPQYMSPQELQAKYRGL